MIAPQAVRYVRNPQTAARVIEGLTFVVTPTDHKLHTLNATATVLWDLAEEGCTIHEAAEKLVSIYEVETDQAAKDIQTCFDDLVARTILIIQD